MLIKTKRGARRMRHQSVVVKRFVVTDYEHCPYITAGKWYLVSGRGHVSYFIIDDTGDCCSVIGPNVYSFNCSHLDDIGHFYHPTI